MKNKKRFIKKASKGLQNIKPETIEAGLGIAGGVAGMAGEALTANATKNKWGKVDKTKAVAGSALSMGAQGAQMGAALGPWGAAIGGGLGLVGGGIKGAIDADKANTEAEYARLGEKNQKFNDTLTSSTINQKTQFKRGGTSKAKKLIEIEGKKTPEIHTDENFNLKNLGTTPHSKGGNKVLAEEGDIVFPTQNSPEKYNKVMKALREKDLPTLKKEKNKLPKDAAPKYDKGTGGVRLREEGIITGFTSNDRLINVKQKHVGESGGKPTNFKEIGKQFKTAPKKEVAKPVVKKGGGKGTSTPLQRGLPMEYATTKDLTVKHDGLSPKGVPQTVSEKIAEQAGIAESIVKAQDAVASNGGDPLNNHLAGALELAPVLHNLGQGLFGKTEKVDRQFLKPELQKYNDLSDPLRQKNTQMESVQKSNARNASGGNMANYRSNAQAAANEGVSRLGEINNQEIARQDQINAQNIQTKNNAGAVNLDLKNKYDELDAMNRGKKSEALASGLQGLGDIGTRSKIEANERSAQIRELEAYAEAGPYKVLKDNKNRYVGTAFGGEPKIAPNPADLQTKNKKGEVVAATEEDKKKTKETKSRFNPFKSRTTK